MNSKMLHMAAYLLVWIGGLNWGLYGLVGVNLVMMLFGSWPLVERVVYVLVGFSAIYTFATHKDNCSVCSEMSKKK